MGGRRGLVGVVSFESGQGKDAVKKDNSRVEELETEIERKNSRAREGERRAWPMRTLTRTTWDSGGHFLACSFV